MNIAVPQQLVTINAQIATRHTSWEEMQCSEIKMTMWAIHLLEIRTTYVPKMLQQAWSWHQVELDRSISLFSLTCCYISACYLVYSLNLYTSLVSWQEKNPNKLRKHFGKHYLIAIICNLRVHREKSTLGLSYSHLCMDLWTLEEKTFYKYNLLTCLGCCGREYLCFNGWQLSKLRIFICSTTCGGCVAYRN